jgi:hypothetical protein
MPTRWAKILVSGSNAEVTNITASDISGPLTDKSQLLMISPGASNPSFLTTSSLFFTESAGGQLYFDNLGLSAHQLFISGIPDKITNDSQVVFYEESSTGLQRTSSLRYEASSNTLKFEGTFSGSFTGDGSGLTGVVGTMENPLVSSYGIASSSGISFEYDGTKAVSMSIFTSSGGGLDFENDGLRLSSSLAGNGLYWHGGSGDYSKISIGIPANSGLTTGSNTLAINSNIGGDGIDFSGGVLSVDLSSSYSGLVLAGSPARLALVSTLAGDGLTFSNGRSKINIDHSYAVTSSATITFKTGSTNLTLLGANATAVEGGFRGNLIDEPTFTYDVSDTLTGNFTLGGNLTINGNLLTTGSTTIAGTLLITDPFPTIKSGSTTGDGGLRVFTGPNKSAYWFWDNDSKRWGVSDDNVAATITAHGIFDTNRAAIVTTTISSDAESTIVNSTPVFGNSANTRTGQLIIKENQTAGESPLFIFA